MHAASLRLRAHHCRHTSCSRTAAAAPHAISACRAPAARSSRLIAARSTFSDVDDGAAAGPSPVAAQALQEYFTLERSGGVDERSLADLRLKYGIRRGVDGRVQLRRRDGVWMACKLDMEVKGTMLLRNTADNSIHILMTDRLEQIDLSDDYLLLMLFADGMWEAQTKPIQLGDGVEVESLQLTEQEFKDFVGLLKTLQELEQEELADEGSGGSNGGGEGPEIDVQAETLTGR